jgi:hypothetical protein
MPIVNLKVSVSLVEPDQMEGITHSCHTPCVVPGCPRGAITKRHSNIWPPLGVDGGRGAEEQRRKGEKKDRKA